MLHQRKRLNKAMNDHSGDYNNNSGNNNNNAQEIEILKRLLYKSNSKQQKLKEILRENNIVVEEAYSGLSLGSGKGDFNDMDDDDDLEKYGESYQSLLDHHYHNHSQRNSAYNVSETPWFPCPTEPRVSFFASFTDRGGWLVGLLVVQSLSGFILSSNEQLLKTHPNIIYYLTMLVGAGGNAGNQAAVRVIRGLAVGAINDKNYVQFLYRESLMGLLLCMLLSAVGLIRVLISANITAVESLAIVMALTVIVFTSVIFGCLLPFLLQYLGMDPAHSSTSIQVIMDIGGVLLTCFIAHVIINLHVGNYLLGIPIEPTSGTISH